MYNKLCGRCGNNKNCFWKYGPKVAPTLHACRQGRSLRTLAAKCSEQTFQRAVAAAPKNGVALKCQRAVYNKLCGRCGNNVGCYWNYGPKVAPTLHACRHRRSLRTLTTKCSEAGFKKAIENAPKTGASLSCQRAVYNALCEECGNSFKCFMQKGPNVARKSPLCRPRETTKYDLADDEEVGRGRDWGRICATAACLFIDGLNPPPPRYTPGPNPIAPIHRQADMMFDSDDEEVGRGRDWGMVCATAACLFIDGLNPPPPRYTPGPNPIAPIHRQADMMFDSDDEEVGRGRDWGRICATAACLFIDGLNPPPPRYTPGPNPIAPIHRQADMMFDSDDEEVGRGRDWGRICATAACLFIDGLNPPPPRYTPGPNPIAPIHRQADMMFDSDDEEVGRGGGDWKNKLREKWGFLSWGFSNKGECIKERFDEGVRAQKTYKPTKVPMRCQVAVFKKCCTRCVSATCFENCALEGGSSIVNACS